MNVPARGSRREDPLARPLPAGAVVTNDDLAARMDTNDEWIRDRVGIASRRIAGPEETVADMAAAAAGKALAASRAGRRRHRPRRRRDLHDPSTDARTWPAGWPPSSASRAPGRVRPQHRLLRLLLRAAATRRPRIRARPRNAIVIGAEKLSDLIDWTDRSTASSSPTAPAPRWSAPAPTTSRPGSARSSGARRRRESATLITIEGWRPVHRPGGPGGLPLGHHRAGPARARRPAARPGSSRPSWPRSSRTRPTCASSRRSPASSARPTRVVAKDIVESGNTSAASDPAGAVQDGRAGRGALRRAGAAVRLRRRPDLRRAGRPLPVTRCRRDARDQPHDERSHPRRNRRSGPRGDHRRPRRDPGGGRRREAGRRQPRRSRSPTTSTSTRCPWSRSRGGRGAVRREDPGRRGAEPQDVGDAVSYIEKAKAASSESARRRRHRARRARPRSAGTSRRPGTPCSPAGPGSPRSTRSGPRNYPVRIAARMSVEPTDMLDG